MTNNMNNVKNMKAYQWNYTLRLDAYKSSCATRRCLGVGAHAIAEGLPCRQQHRSNVC